MISTAAPGMGVVMLVMSHPGATEICISKPLSESIMTFSDIDTHRKCSNLAIKQPLQGRNHTVICNSDVFIYSYTTQFIEGDKTHVLFVIIGCHTYLDLLYSTHCVLYFRDGHIVYHYYGIRCITEWKSHVKGSFNMASWYMEFISLFWIKTSFFRYGFTDFLCII